MPIFFLIINLLAVIIASITIIIAYKLSRNNRHVFFGSFFFFILCSVISGFFDWTAFNLIVFSIPNFPNNLLDRIYHIFWDFIGYPLSLAALYFLLITLFEFQGKKLNSRAKITIIFLLFILSLAGIVNVTSISGLLAEIKMLVYTLFLPVCYFSLLLYTYFSLWGNKDWHSLTLKRFIIILSSGLIAWYAVSNIPGRTLAGYKIVVYYIALILPALYLYIEFRKKAIAQILEESGKGELALFFKTNEFTVREREIIALLFAGKSNKDIEDELFISLQTVKNYTSRIYKKQNVKSRVELINKIRNKQN